MADLTVKKGDYGFDLEFTIQNDDGTANDLAGYTVKLKMWEPGVSLNKFTGTCVIIDAANGKCKYTVAQTDFDTVKSYIAELELTKYGVIEDTKSFTIDVVETAPQ